MNNTAVVTALAALAQESRLSVYRLLVKRGPAGFAAGEISAQLGIPGPTLSFHLKELSQAGLVTARKESRYIYYAANFERMNDLLAYLTENCCGLGVECAPACMPAPVHVLFLCTGNSCRSILAEATFNHLAPAGWRAMSAGSKPTGKVHPRSLALLARESIVTDGYHSKSWDDLPATPDIVITVCANAAGETCPAYLGPVLRTHWGVDDPAHATGTDAEIDAQFFKAYRTLRSRIEAMLALPLAELAQDRAAFKAELDRIGTTVT